MNAERRKSAATGRAAWLVRVGPSSHRELKALAQRLEAEGFSVARRWRCLFAGANCEDDTHALADQIRGYSSVGTRIRVQRVYDRPRKCAYRSRGRAIFGLKLRASGIPLEARCVSERCYAGDGTMEVGFGPVLAGNLRWLMAVLLR